VAKTVKDFLTDDPLARFDRDFAKIEVSQRFGELLPQPAPFQVFGALLPFVTEIPWRYWDPETVKLALLLLEEDQERTIQAIKSRRIPLNRGMDNLFRPSRVIDEEKAFSQRQSLGVVRLATEFFPEYLRWVEHVFGNLIEVYWAIKKRGGVDGGFGLRGGTTLLAQQGLDYLLNGYVENIRNAIAHGNFNFTGLDIEFGDVRPDRYSVTEFLRTFDELCRTSNGLGVALILFWARNNPASRLNDSIPLSIVTRFAAGGVNRTGLTLVGAVESYTPLVGRQLHVAVRMSMQSRTLVFGECCRVAMHLLDAGAKNYERFLIEIDHGKHVNSLAVMLPKIFENILKNNEPIERLSEAFSETQLLWFNEGAWKTRLRAWHIILLTGVRHMKLDILNNWRELGLWVGKGRFLIREVENLGIQGIARLRIRAVLKNPTDAQDEHIIKEIIHEIVKTGKWRFVKSRGQFLDSGIAWRKRPSHIFVELYRVDGTLRWLSSGGWQSGNLVALAEYTRGNQDPIIVDNPEEIYKGIRIRYSMDSEKAREALHKLTKLIADIHKNRFRNI
jgi:hypothetical protein